MMNLIDIASWQRGIDLPTLFDRNPIDGVIVKATQGTGYINPDYAVWAKWLVDHDKPLGLYHYLDGVKAESEAEYFYNTVKPYVGKAVFAADYEDVALAKGTVWLKQFLDRFYTLSGIKCLVYCSQSVLRSQDFKAIASAGYQLWVAQYADMKTVNGFVDKPWQSGSVAPFDKYVMHQYTSCGRLHGYSGNLDFDKFYGSYSAWNELCKSNCNSPKPSQNKIKPVDALVISEILDGKYGNGIERMSRLKSAGYDAEACQSKVNELYAIALSCKKYTAGNEGYLNQIVKIIRLL